MNVKKQILLIITLLISFSADLLSQSSSAERVRIVYPDYDSFKPKVALVLSGGGARGISQVGAIEELEASGLSIDYVVGTSIGSIVGGLLASGYSSYELDSIITGIDWYKIFSVAEQNNRNDLFLDQKVIQDRSLLTLKFKNFKFVLPEAISAGDDFNMTLQNVFWNSLYKPEGDFNNLKYKFRAVTTDLISGQSISQRYGSIISAVRASATIPLRYTPVRRDSLVLIDGGIFANVPVDAALEFKPDMIIAVNTVSPLLNRSELNTPWNIADQVVSISMEKFTQEQLKKADFVITPKISNHKNTEFVYLDSLIRQGKIAASSMMKQISERYVQIRDSIMNEKFNKGISNRSFENKVLVLSNFEYPDSVYFVNGLQAQANLARYNDLLSFLMMSGRYEQLEAVFEGDTLFLTASRYKRLNSIRLIGCENQFIKDFISNHTDSDMFAYLSPINKRNLVESIIKQYRNQGYSYASISNIREDVHGNIFLTVDEGIIHKILITGNESTSKFLIRRELKFQQGEPVNADKIVKGWNNLKKTGLFSTVDIYIEEDPLDNSNVLNVKVVEDGTQAIRLGGRVDNERFGQIGIDLIQENLFNAGIRLAGRMVAGSRNQSYTLLIDNPRIFNSQMAFSSSGYYSLKNVNQFMLKPRISPDKYEREKIAENSVERLGVKVGIGNQIDKNGIFGLEYRLEKQRNYNLDSAKGDFYNISTLRISTTFDSENRADFPTSGQLIDISLETGILSISPSTKFSKAFFSYHANVTFDDLTIKPAILFGVADKTLPYPEFFSLGGENSFFGYREDEERGRQIFKSSIEWRLKLPFKLFFDTYISARYDLGAVWEKPESVRFNDLKHGFGSSVQFDTPLGPAKFSVARSFYFTSTPSNGIVRGMTLGYFSIGMRF